MLAGVLQSSMFDCSYWPRGATASRLGAHFHLSQLNKIPLQNESKPKSKVAANYAKDSSAYQSVIFSSMELPERSILQEIIAVRNGSLCVMPPQSKLWKTIKIMWWP